jgi:NitT/TauT family transport system substrate-binding protein
MLNHGDGKMNYACDVRRKFSVIAVIQLVAAVAVGHLVAPASAQRIATAPAVTGAAAGATHASPGEACLTPACNSLAPTRLAQAQTGRPLEKVTLLLDFTPYGKHAPFFAALDKGFWKDAGFDVTIIKGEGSATTVSSYAAGTVDFAFSDTPTLILARAKGALIKAAGIIHDKSLYAIGTLEENNIKTPQDLKGKRIGGSLGDASRVMFPAFAKINGIDAGSVRWVDMTPPARVASLVLGQIDAVTLFMTEQPTFSAKAKEGGKHWKDFPYADYGLDLYSHGLLVRDELIANQPDRVKRWVESTMQAWAWSVENPREALASFLKHNPAVDPDQAREHFRIAIKHLMTDTAKREGMGTIDPEKMKRTVEFVSQYFDVKGVSADDVYTNRFTPKLFPKEAPF